VTELMSGGAPLRVVVAGGGVAALEATLALSRLAEGRVDVELLAPADEFVYRPLLVAEPFGSAEILRLELERFARDAGARRRRDALASVDPEGRTILTASDARVGYDALLVAVGAHPVQAVPGALTFAEEAERRRFSKLLTALGRRGTRRLAFVVPRQATWSIAAYELALLTAAERDARDLYGVELSLVTHEAAPLDLFGHAAAELVGAKLEEADIALRAASVVERFEDGLLQLAGGESLAADAAVALPALEVPRLPGLPQRARGFVATDTEMNVSGLQHVWAAGDVTWFPIKQGGLAAQQADVAARSIAVEAGARVAAEPFEPVLRAALITGGAPEFLRAPVHAAEDAVAAVGRALWSPPAKLAGRYLAPYLARAVGETSAEELLDLDAPAQPEADAAAHARVIELVLAAAEADARIGDFENAIRWLSLVEELDLVLPPEYVARRHEWRRRLDPEARPDPAAKRIDPSFGTAAEAISDLRARVGWLREMERSSVGHMRRDLSALDQGMEELVSLARRTGVLRASGNRSG
jgi:sulfide:quinone oxidoreductase